MSQKAIASGLSHLRVTLTDKAYIGPGRADLLEQIVVTGSISAAGKAMGMSYKRAWGLVQALNDGFGFVVVETARGGPGQGAQLTEAGTQVLAAYRAMQAKTRDAIAPEVAALEQLITDMSGSK